MAKKHQAGRVDKNSTKVEFNYTERWFSGQATIGKRIGWSRQQVSQYLVLIDKIATQVLDLTRQRQKGRVSENATDVAFDFTEGWFRSSGLYDRSKNLAKLILSHIF